MLHAPQVGLEDWELSRIRINLLLHASPADLLSRLSVRSPKARSSALTSLDAREEAANLRRVIASKGQEGRSSHGMERCAAAAAAAACARECMQQAMHGAMRRTHVKGGAFSCTTMGAGQCQEARSLHACTSDLYS
jgi:hypothetical protein